MWLNERPKDRLEKPLHDAKVLVMCAISCRKIYGPYFLEESLNKHMLKFFFYWPKHYRVESHKKYYFQHDEATPHTVQEWLQSKFGEKFITKKFMTHAIMRASTITACE